MAQITKRGLANNAVGSDKILIENNQPLRFLGANGTDIFSLVTLGVDNVFNLNALPKYLGSNVATEQYVDDAIANLTGAFIYKGTYDASTNTPTLANGVGSAGELYAVTVAGAVDFGAGPITFAIGDKVVYNGTVWEKWDVNDNELATSTTDNLAEGTNNLYFTPTRAQDAVVVNTLVNDETNKAPSVEAVKSFVFANANRTGYIDFTSLTATDIANGYVDLPVGAYEILDVQPRGFPSQFPAVDYDLTTAPSGVLRLIFLGDMLTLVAGDRLRITYLG